LEQLSKLSPDDLDGLSQILSEWSVNEARIVLDELGKRLKLIEMLENLVEDPSVDELHQIQPLFEKGLWIFGPEYESIDFIANKSLHRVMKTFFKDEEVELSTPRKRPDLICLPDSTISIYSADAYDEEAEVNGFSKILIIELKRGGFTIGRKEKQQAQEYAIEIRKSGKIEKDTPIVGFVLGASIDPDAQEPVSEGKTTIFARTYSVVLRQAHARVFNLQEKIKDIKIENGVDGELLDDDIEQLINKYHQTPINM
jgi:hypothetical protein